MDRRTRGGLSMTRYQLAKLVEWAGILHSRKRLQKVVFLLQAAGCPVDAEYILHRYGPYSQEVARLSDEMVQVGLLKESSEQNSVGVQYSYALTENAAKEIAELDRAPKGKKLASQLTLYENQAKKLLSTDVGLLEIASTMVYFRKQGNSWAESVEKTCEFKKLAKSSGAVAKGEELARQFVN